MAIDLAWLRTATAHIERWANVDIGKKFDAAAHKIIPDALHWIAMQERCWTTAQYFSAMKEVNKHRNPLGLAHKVLGELLDADLALRLPFRDGNEVEYFRNPVQSPQVISLTDYRSGRTAVVPLPKAIAEQLQLICYDAGMAPHIERLTISLEGEYL